MKHECIGWPRLQINGLFIMKYSIFWLHTVLSGLLVVPHISQQAKFALTCPSIIRQTLFLSPASLTESCN